MGGTPPEGAVVPLEALVGRRVVLGVSGGIAAYKAVEVCRRLVDAGAFVSPVMTADATRFIGAVTLSALASEPVRTSLWDSPEPIPHTRLGQNADVIVVVPATARVIGAYTHGISDGLLIATLLATRAPVVLCPAMHTEMWEHPAVQDNLAVLRRRGVHIVEPGVGRLAGGDSGAGRLAEPADIVAAVAAAVAGPTATGPTATGPTATRATATRATATRATATAPGPTATAPGPTATAPGPTATAAAAASPHGDLTGRTVLVTAGGTREPIDAVRVITNRSSGKQGYAIAAEAASRGARVILVTTVDRAVPPGMAEVVKVATALDMETAVLPRAAAAHVIVMAAAVADFRPKAPATRKIKKDDGPPDIVLEPTHDFLVDLGRAKPAGQVLIGFAAETDDLLDNARRKLHAKRLDLIVANDVGEPGAGFEHDTNRVTILGSDGSEASLPLASKADVARAVVDAAVHRLPPVQGATQ